MTGKASLTVAAPSGVLVGVFRWVIAGSDGIGQQEAIAGGAPSLHVLVVDDDAAVRKACCDIVERRGSAAMGAESVAAARAILKHQKIDLLLLDLKLPDGGGLALLEQVKTAVSGYCRWW